MWNNDNKLRWKWSTATPCNNRNEKNISTQTLRINYQHSRSGHSWSKYRTSITEYGSHCWIIQHFTIHPTGQGYLRKIPPCIKVHTQNTEYGYHNKSACWTMKIHPQHDMDQSTSSGKHPDIQSTHCTRQSRSTTKIWWSISSRSPDPNKVH